MVSDSGNTASPILREDIAMALSDLLLLGQGSDLASERGVHFMAESADIRRRFPLHI